MTVTDDPFDAARPPVGAEPAGGAPPEFTCPRCGSAATERFYGPCAPCRDQLRTTQGGDVAEQVTVERFEPSMHVVPNHVATKD